MTGKDFINFKNSKKINFKSKKVQCIIIIILSALLGFFPAIIITNWLDQEEPLNKPFVNWYKVMPTAVLLDWNNIAKLTFLYFAPFIVIVIGVSWVIHGFGFIIVRR